MENFAEILENYFQERTYEVGDQVEGPIVKMGRNYALVDIGTKKEAALPLEELKDLEGNLIFNLGDRVRAIVVKRISQEDQFLLSTRKILEEEALKRLKEAFEKGDPIEVKLSKPVKAGYEVIYEGLIKGFLPQSQLLRSQSSEGSERIKVLLLKLNERSFVASQRAYQQRERELKLKELERKIQEGEILEGKVKGSVKGGYLLDFDGLITGFLPLSEVTRRRLRSGESYLAEGDQIAVKVLEWDPEKRKLKVSHKVLELDPWEGVEDRYRPDQRVKGKVVKIENFGAFVELEPGLEGLLPASEISWKKGLKPKDILQEGDLIEAIITELNPQERKLILSLRRLEENPWETVAKELRVGQIVEAPIKTVTDFGLFVEIREGVDGFIHVSQVSWDRVEDLKSLFKVGDLIKAKVIELNPENKRLALSIRELKPNPWIEFSQTHKVGEEIEGEIKKEVPGKGYLLRIEEGITGFLPMRELAETRKSKALREGERVKGIIITLDPEQKRLWVSEKAYILKEEKAEVLAYQGKVSQESSKGVSKIKIEL